MNRCSNEVDNPSDKFRDQDGSAASKALWEKIKDDPVEKSKFSSLQQAQLEGAKPKISGMTWHHAGHSLNANGTGTMMLVESVPHTKFTHKGWYSFLKNGEI